VVREGFSRKDGDHPLSSDAIFDECIQIGCVVFLDVIGPESIERYKDNGSMGRLFVTVYLKQEKGEEEGYDGVHNVNIRRYATGIWWWHSGHIKQQGPLSEPLFQSIS
jgi:hypothetical protein